jgi:hypothetical protein
MWTKLSCDRMFLFLRSAGDRIAPLAAEVAEAVLAPEAEDQALGLELLLHRREEELVEDVVGLVGVVEQERDLDRVQLFDDRRHRAGRRADARELAARGHAHGLVLVAHGAAEEQPDLDAALALGLDRLLVALEQIGPRGLVGGDGGDLQGEGVIGAGSGRRREGGDSGGSDRKHGTAGHRGGHQGSSDAGP